MAISNAPGQPDYTGTLIPEVWAPELLVKFYRATVFGKIANTDYAGNITAMGDVVHIRTTPTVEIDDYVTGQKLEFQRPEPSMVDLEISNAKTYAIAMDDVDILQSNYDALSDWADDAGLQLAIQIDKDILANIYSDVDSKNAGGTAGVISGSYNLGATGSPLSITKDNIVDVLNDAEAVLMEQDVPNDALWAVMPTWAVNLIKKSWLRSADDSGDARSIARDGYVGNISNFEIYQSNSLATVTDASRNVTEIVCGHMSGLTFASQLLKNEGPYTPDDYFEKRIRGLTVYGYKVVKPEAIVHVHGYKG